MCDACIAKGKNWSLANGPVRSNLERAKFYASFEGREVSIKLCYLCSMKLFLFGEKNFLDDNKILKKELTNQYSADEFDY
ncbi:hypothetical protein [Bacteriovorax sp. DB6_IX]|uniref:hypothetical protein n=1 Tax=Bacteriovorax sp. DB6_IX TaxID=1353530 RepID=UPI00038A36CA|nr:hypothetical protein [Bacteriovorax sp. DB6_IX]EQC50851.1 hypothetical protein M901_1838 [Bacteriovorax sp. DB6_IX]